MSHPAAFLATLAAAGIAPSDPAAIVADGQLHRFHIDGDKPGRRNGWAVLHLDGLAAGAFGSWKHGIAGSWCAKDRASLTPAERADHRRRIARAREQAQAARTRAQAAAAARAARLWAQARPADVLHPYRVQKAVPLFSARQLGARLVLPVADFAGRLHSLQFIDGAGGKKLLKDGRKRGHFIRVAGRMPPAARVLICEGWATGATLATLEPAALVLAAIDAGNLGAVAVGARQHWPAAEIVVCADADPVGIAKARAAAIAAAALVAIPAFPAGAEGSDFNDLANLAGGAA